MSRHIYRLVESFLDKKPQIHFIGIGGTGMSALAGICLSYGYTVTGSDIAQSENIEQLVKLGAKVYFSHSEKNVEGSDIVVFSSAIRPDNVELVAAVRGGRCVLERHKFLGALFNCFEESIAVAGSHGKTTACGMLSYILLEAGRDPQILIGGNLALIGGNFRKGRGCCLAEACEYRRNFLALKPLVPVILNVEKDHMDYFKDEEDLVDAYLSFAKNGRGTCVVNGDDSNCIKIIPHVKCATFGFGKGNDCYPKEIRGSKGRYSFTLCHGERQLKISLSVNGRHNIYNAMAAYLAASLLGIEGDVIASALSKYKGIGRRFENVGKAGGIPIICDYAHHPKEIKAVIDAARETFGKNVIAVFQPHTYTRTKALMEEFEGCFGGAAAVLLLPVYAAREEYDAGGSSIALYERLSRGHPNAYYLDNFHQASLLIRRMRGSCVLLLGAGDIFKLAELTAD
jgi:UDP-N-acetylmuramate--alanine ligase